MTGLPQAPDRMIALGDTIGIHRPSSAALLPGCGMARALCAIGDAAKQILAPSPAIRTVDTQGLFPTANPGGVAATREKFGHGAGWRGPQPLASGHARGEELAIHGKRGP